jgi:[FeFe] hydrogenase H-cluster maturation GTPase HydF
MNAGKSSLVNAVTGQETALVSETPGTTTDPVYKNMELLPAGPIVLIDTAGLDDSGELGEKRVKRSLEVLEKCDFAVIAIDGRTVKEGDLNREIRLSERFQEKQIPYIAALTRADVYDVPNAEISRVQAALKAPVARVSCRTGAGVELLKRLIIENAGGNPAADTIAGDLLKPGDLAVLVVPIDNAAPKGRLILPQVQTIRDILDHDAQALVVKERELAVSLRGLSKKPKIVITDSQVFQKVAADTPPDVLLTSFSILFARYKGDLELYMKGIRKIRDLKDGDRILIAEGCTHHVQSDDIGTVKIPRWLRELTGKDLRFEKVSGQCFPDDLSDYALVVNCGSCMLTRREVQNRLAFSEGAGVPATNYGMLIAHVFGILDRALEPFPVAKAVWNGDIY